MQTQTNKISDYTQAPATLLFATHCCACGRPLLDSESVRTGIGPTCAEKYGVSQELHGSAEHTLANALVYKIAAEQKVAGWNNLAVLIAELRALPNFGSLADKITKRLQPKPTVFLTVDYIAKFYPTSQPGICSRANIPAIRVVCPYNEEATAAWRNIPGREFRKETVEVKNEKTGLTEKKEICFNRVPSEQKRAVFALLQKFYSGHIAQGPKGVFEISAAE